MFCYYSLMWMVIMLVSSELLTWRFPNSFQPLLGWKTLKNPKEIPLIKTLYCNLFVIQIHLLLFRHNLSYVSLIIFYFAYKQVISESSRRLKKSWLIQKLVNINNFFHVIPLSLRNWNLLSTNWGKAPSTEFMWYYTMVFVASGK